MEEIGLGLRIWEGVFEGNDLSWLRWCDQKGNLIPTGKELADATNQRALFAEERASTAEEYAIRLAEQLRSLGITPEA
jgi:alkylated DNA nucleotide flippase Atl1